MSTKSSSESHRHWGSDEEDNDMDLFHSSFAAPPDVPMTSPTTSRHTTVPPSQPPEPQTPTPKGKGKKKRTSESASLTPHPPRTISQRGGPSTEETSTPPPPSAPAASTPDPATPSLGGLFRV